MSIGFICEGNTSNNYIQASIYLEESKSLFQELGNLRGIAEVSHCFGTLALMQEDYEKALPLLEEAIIILEPFGQASICQTLVSLGRLHYDVGNYQEAFNYFERAISIYEKSGQILGMYFLQPRLGYAYLRVGELVQAQTIFLQSLHDFNQLEDTFGIEFSLTGLACSLEGLASLETSRNQPEKAVKLFAWADATRKIIHDPRPPNEQKEVEQDTSAIREMISEEAFATAYAIGEKMTTEEAIALALET